MEDVRLIDFKEDPHVFQKSEDNFEWHCRECKEYIEEGDICLDSSFWIPHCLSCAELVIRKSVKMTKGKSKKCAMKLLKELELKGEEYRAHNTLNRL